MKQGRNQHISYLEGVEKAELGNILDNYTWPLLVVSIILIGKKKWNMETKISWEK